MRYKSSQIRENLRWFVIETKQPELYHVINYAMGYYGSIYKQVWWTIQSLIDEGLIKP